MDNDKYLDNVTPELLKDLTCSQKKVLKIRTQNVLVNAGAGSGKTTVLTRRVIHLLKDLHYSLNQIIVLTFTDLAAKQMKDKIIEALENENDPLLKEELTHIDEANIMTFDAFCHDMLIKYNAYSTIDSTFSIGDDALFTMKKKEFIRNNLLELHFYEQPTFNELVSILGLTEAKSLVDKIAEIYDDVENELDPKDAVNKHYIYAQTGQLYNTIIDKLEDIIRFKAKRLYDIKMIPIDDKTQEYVDKYDVIVDKLNNAKDLAELFLLLKSEQPSVRVPKSETIFRPTRDRFLAAYDSIKEIFEPFDSFSQLKDIFDAVSSIEMNILSIIEKTIDDMEEFKKEFNIYSFQDIATECIRMLNEHPEVCNYYKKQIKEILIDEYQDTNDINSTLISLISNNNEVVVGDVKQSIYRFRNANPDIFQNRYNQYNADEKLGEVIDLDENFRSRNEEVVKVVNDIFVHLSKDDSINSDFFKNEMKYGLKDYSNHPHSLDKFKIIEVDPDDKEHNEADYIAQDILNRLSNGQQKYNYKTKSLEDAKLGDFLVLAYASTNFDLYKRTFEKYGIPVRVTGDVSFSDSYEVIFIKNVLYMVYLFDNGLTTDKNFDSTLVSIMRSFVFNLKDNMIIKYMAEKKKTSSIDALKTILPDLYNIFIELKDIYNTYGITSLINEINVKFNVYESLLKVDDKESREAKLNILISQIETYAKSGMSLESIIDYFNYLKKNKVDTSAKISPLNDLSCLEIMTIHKSKGLERPFVYVCDLKKQLKAPNVKYSKSLGVNLKIADNVKTILINLEEKRERNREFFRLLYVALTRARESLTLMFSAKEQSDVKDIYNFSNLQQFFLYNHSFNDDVYTTIDFTNSVKEKEEFTPKEGEVDIEYKTLNLKPKTKIERKHASHDAINVDEETRKNLERGTLLHSFFEVTNFLTGDINKELENKKVADVYKKYLINFSKKSIFVTPSLREFHELPYYGDEGVGVIDYAIEKEDELIIVDFKTSRIDDPAYVDQLRTYKEFMATRINKPIKTYLYSMMKNELKEIET